MTGTNHGMTGAVIAFLVKDPLLAIPLSFASHFACDAIPHFGVEDGKLFGRKFNIILVADFLIAVSLMVLFGIWFPGERLLIWACMIAAASPDLMWAYYELYVQFINKRKPQFGPLARFHVWIQWSQTAKGVSVEVFWFLLMGLTVISRR